MYIHLIWIAAIAIVSWVFPLVTKKLRKSFADDIALSIQQAHFGWLPKGQYAGQRVYAKKLSREQLCTPLDAETLAKMAQCTKRVHHDVKCTGVSCKMQAMAEKATAEVTVSVHFEGEMADGSRMTVDVQDAHLLAEFSIHEIHGWTLNSLQETQK